MALIVLDASVVIAHLDATDALHEAAVSAIERYDDSDLLLPASAYAEVLVGPIAVGRVEHARRALDGLRIELVAIGATAAEAAARIRAERPAIRLPDALVLGCAEAIDAAAVLTADRRWADLPRVELIA